MLILFFCEGNKSDFFINKFTNCYYSFFVHIYKKVILISFSRKLCTGAKRMGQSGTVFRFAPVIKSLVECDVTGINW